MVKDTKGMPSPLHSLLETWRQRAQDDMKYGVSKARVTGNDLKGATREYFGTVNAAFAIAECADELEATLTASPQPCDCGRPLATMCSECVIEDYEAATGKVTTPQTSEKEKAVTETIYRRDVPAIELCFDTDCLNVWDGSSVAQFKVTGLRSLVNIFDEVLGPEYQGCSVYATVWAKSFLVKSAEARPLPSERS